MGRESPVGRDTDDVVEFECMENITLNELTGLREKIPTECSKLSPSVGQRKLSGGRNN